MNKTVHELYLEAVALQKQGIRPMEIKERLIDLGHDNGFSTINDRGSGGGGQPTVIELEFFTGGEVIYFDGAEWHHRA
jgi:hypothetical protein